jgi:hypothetical protein
MIGYTQPTVTPAVPVSTRTGLSASDFGPGEIPVQAQSTGDIVSDRYTAMAKAAGLTPATSTPSSDDLYDLKRRVGYGIDAQGNPIVASDSTNKGLPAGFTAGPFPAALEKLFGSSAGYLGYRIENDVDKDGKTFFRLSVLTSPNSWQTFGAAFTQGPNGYEPFSPNYGTKDAGPSGPTGPTGPTKTYTAPDGRIFTDLNAYNAYITQTKEAAATAERKSAYDLLYQQFAKYGLQALVTPLEGLIKEGVPASEFAIRLRETDAYQKRFAANKSRINKGLAALSEAEYIGLEDAYQGIMRQYGMPETYYTRGDMGRQEGFEKFIAGDVSPKELETRISTAYNRVINANPEVVQSLKQYYPNITNGDILSYVLDPEKALTDINKKVTAAEIGGAALGAGLGINVARAEELGAFGVTKAQAEQGYQNIAEFLEPAKKLGDIYRRSGLGPYTQAVAEQEVFGISGAADAAKKRKQLTQLETAQFSGQVGVGALGRERAGQF